MSTNQAAKELFKILFGTAVKSGLVILANSCKIILKSVEEVDGIDILTKRTHSKIVPYWRQFFISVIVPLLENSKNPGTVELTFAAETISGFEMKDIGIKNLLAMSNCFLTALKMSANDEKSLSGAMNGLELVILDGKQSALTLINEHQKKNPSNTTSLSLVDDLQRIIIGKNTENTSNTFPVQVRQAACRVLGCLHVLHDTSMVNAHAQTIRNILSSAVEDRKRLVRREAAKAFAVWSN